MSDLALVVDPEDPTPPYEQLRRQLADLVQTGALPPGDRLPPLRQLAGDLGLAVGTVARTYRELETEGLLITRRGAGTRVARDAPRLDHAEKQRRLQALTDTYVARAHAIGASDQQIRDALRRAGAA